MITFQKEAFKSIMPELPALFAEHWEHVALDKKQIQLEPDWEGYLKYEEMGILHVLTVRDDGCLLGYCFALVMNNLHYKSTKMAWSDIFWLSPYYRRSGWGMLTVGYKLFRNYDTMLKSLGVRKSFIMTKVHLPLRILMKRLGYKFIEEIHAKLL